MSVEQFDVVIVGAGGAGLTAAIYTSRAELKTVVIEKMVPGGQIAITDLVENFPGFPEGIMGPEIGSKMEAQAKRCGAHVRYGEVEQIEKNNDDFIVTTDSGTIECRAVILATGAEYRHLNIPGEESFTGKGVSYCATCDGPFFKNKTIAVIGGGDSALQEALFLSTLVKKCYLVHRRDQLRAGPLLQKRARENATIEFVLESVPTEIQGAQMVSKLIVKNVKTDELREIDLDGVFIFIGHTPASTRVRQVVDCDDHGYITTDESLQTSMPGIFACGEVRAGATRQLVAVCGEGCRAALSVQHYLDDK